MTDWRDIAKEFGSIGWSGKTMMTSDNCLQRMAEEIIRLRKLQISDCENWIRAVDKLDKERAYTTYLLSVLKKINEGMVTGSSAGFYLDLLEALTGKNSPQDRSQGEPKS